MAHVHSSREYGELDGARGTLGAVLVFLPGIAEIQVAAEPELRHSLPAEAA